MKMIGYLRTSTREQNPQRQIDALTAICDSLHIEQLSAATLNRPVYRAVVDSLEAGDSLCVTSLDRAFRSAIDALTELERLRRRGVYLRIIDTQIETASPHGEFIYTVMAAWGRLEQRLISTRTKEGLAAAKARGVRLGRPRKLTAQQLDCARRKLERGAQSIGSLAAEFGVTPWTLKRSLRRSSFEARHDQGARAEIFNHAASGEPR